MKTNKQKATMYIFGKQKDDIHNEATETMFRSGFQKFVKPAQINVGEEDKEYNRPKYNNQIVLHHTVSGEGVRGDVDWWEQLNNGVGAHYIIEKYGYIYRLMDKNNTTFNYEDFQIYFNFFYHLGTKDKNLNKQAIGIEIDNWGGLVLNKKDNRYYPAKWDNGVFHPNVNAPAIPEEEIQFYPDGYRGFYAFQKYTDEQILSLEKMLLYHNLNLLVDDKLKIKEIDKCYNLNYNSDMWDVSQRALNYESGIWSHTSYRSDKSDCHPQPELIEMLKNINDIWMEMIKFVWKNKYAIYAIGIVDEDEFEQHQSIWRSKISDNLASLQDPVMTNERKYEIKGGIKYAKIKHRDRKSFNESNEYIRKLRKKINRIDKNLINEIEKDMVDYYQFDKN